MPTLCLVSSLTIPPVFRETVSLPCKKQLEVGRDTRHSRSTKRIMVAAFCLARAQFSLGREESRAFRRSDPLVDCLCWEDSVHILLQEKGHCLLGRR